MPGNDLSRKQWVYALALVTSLFFTWGFAYGVCNPPPLSLHWFVDQADACGVLQLLDVLNAHFQQVFGIDRTQSTLLQLAYFVRVRFSFCSCQCSSD